MLSQRVILAKNDPTYRNYITFFRLFKTFFALCRHLPVSETSKKDANAIKKSIYGAPKI